MLMKPPRCWRNRTDCTPLHSIEGGLPAEMSDRDWDALESGALNPPSFVCGGCVKVSERVVEQDAYRLCWVNDDVDETGEYDEQDIAHQMAVLSQMLGIISARRTASGTIHVLDDDGSLRVAKIR